MLYLLSSTLRSLSFASYSTSLILAVYLIKQRLREISHLTLSGQPFVVIVSLVLLAHQHVKLVNQELVLHYQVCHIVEVFSFKGLLIVLCSFFSLGHLNFDV